VPKYTSGTALHTRYFSDEQAAADRERAAWNRAVDARKEERRARRGK
jgi:hypothetical protein